MADLVELMELGVIEREQDKPMRAKSTCSKCGERGHSKQWCGHERAPRYVKR